MKTKQQTIDNTFPATLDELIMDMELYPDEYKHLQFILNRPKNHCIDFGQMYMVVNQDGFGLYSLDNIDYKEGVILLSFTNPMTGNSAEYSLLITNKHPNVFLVNWKDIEDIVYSELSSDFNDKELRELGNEL
jgi:hypothetical protein